MMHTTYVRLHQRRGVTRNGIIQKVQGINHGDGTERAGSCQCSRNLKSSRRRRDANKWSSTAPGQSK